MILGANFGDMYRLLDILIWWCNSYIYSVKRQATGVWKCLRCKKVMAGGAYVLRYVTGYLNNLQFTLTRLPFQKC